MSQPVHRASWGRLLDAAFVASMLAGCLDDAEPVDAGSPDAVMDHDAGVDADEAPDIAIAPDRGAGCPAAAVVEPGDVEQGRLCEGRTRLAIDAPGGQVLAVDVGALDAPLAVALWWTPGGRVDRIEVDSDSNVEWVQPVDATVELLLSGTGTDRWRVAVRAMPRDTEAVTVSGRVAGARRVVTEDGLGDPEPWIPAGARVDLVDDGRVAAVGQIDDGGDFSLTAALPAGTPVTVRVVSETTAARGAVRVGPDAELPWSETIAEVVGTAEIDATLDPAGATTAAAFVARTAAAGWDRLVPWLPDVPAPPVRIRWRPGFSAPCGSCFRPGAAPLIDLGGRISDPDQWDEAIILHELGHHIAAAYSRDDSAGGPHDGGRTDPAIAWSEGWATFHAGWQLGSPVLLDYKITGVASTDLEQMDDQRAVGTADGTAEGDISELLVAAALWDLIDAPEPDDDLARLAIDDLFTAVFDTLDGSWVDRGARGIDLVDLVDALACVVPAARESEVATVLESRAFAHAPVCRAKCGAPVTLVREGDRVVAHAAADGLLVLDDGLAGFQMTVTTGDVVTWRPRGKADFIGAVLSRPGRRAVAALRWNAERRTFRQPVRHAGTWMLSDPERSPVAD